MQSFKKFMSLMMASAIVLSVTFVTSFADQMVDSDNDGLSDAMEDSLGTNGTKADTDGDGLNDGDEVNLYKSNPKSKDSDQDNLMDFDEVNTYKTNPNKADSDDDGLNDFSEINAYATDPLKKDTDEDGLSDLSEITVYKTDPTKLDTDADGVADSMEVKEGYDPLNENIPYEGGIKCPTPEIERIMYGSKQVYPFGNGKFAIDPVKASQLVVEFKGCEFAGLTYEVQFDDQKYVDANYSVAKKNITSNTAILTTPAVLDVFYNELGKTDGKGYFRVKSSNKMTSMAIGLEMDFTGFVAGASDENDEAVEVMTEEEADSDMDGISDIAEETLYKTNPYDEDSDNDGLTDEEEISGRLNVKFYNKGTNPLAVDTDGDGYSDQLEISYGSNPNSVKSIAGTEAKDVKVAVKKQKTGADFLAPPSPSTKKKPYVKVNASGMPEPAFKPIPAEEMVAPFKDIDGSFAAVAINGLRELGLAKGRAEGVYAPSANITRGELVDMAMRGFNHDVEKFEGEKVFKDVDVTADYSASVAAAKNLNIINGYADGTFKPNQNISRAEAVKILLLAAGVKIDDNQRTYMFTDVDNSKWYAPFVAKAAQNKIVRGYYGTTLFGPENNMTRAECASVIYQIIAEFYLYI